jgi:hypothetical protein
MDLLDKDRNGELSAAEMSAISEALLTWDRNKDGRLSRDEIPQPRFGGPPRGGERQLAKLVDRFDADKDGVLSRGERDAARNFLKENPRGGPGRRRGGPDAGAPPQPGKQISVSAVDPVPGDLYDETVLRTVFLEFAHDDWEEELAAFYRSDVDVPATATVDGRRYANVGVRFRGNSSFFALGPGQKRSFNLAFDFIDDKQNLRGHRTVNLLNAHTDPSFLRTVLFNHVARNYTPAPRANYVRVVVNGENWGVYVNAQQYNKDFIEQWFDERGGVRWKVPAGFQGRGLIYAGDDKTAYSGYELKSADSDKAWNDLIDLCRRLNETPIEELDSRLDAVLNLDRVLWFLALDNVLLDVDGYHSRGSDYTIYQDKEFGRFHVMPYDSNETLRMVSRGRGGPGGRGRGGPGGRPPGGPQPPNQPGAGEPPEPFGLSPFAGQENPQLPLTNRLLANPRLRARYVAHVRTLVDEWLRWDAIGAVAEEHHQLIRPHVLEDTRKLYPSEAFLSSLEENGTGRRPAPGMRPFVEGRRKYLLGLPELKAPAPVIDSLEILDDTIVVAHVGDKPEVVEMVLYYSTKRNAPFVAVQMQPRKEGFAASIPPQPLGTEVFYYVEARTAERVSTFSPRATELGARRFVSEPRRVLQPTVVISEVMPSGSKQEDPQGEVEDWIELHNTADKAVDVSGMHLTDTLKKPTKWRIPSGTSIPPDGRLLIWADGDSKDDGLHANFKLARFRESVWLLNHDGSRVFDRIDWANVPLGKSVGRADGKTRLQAPSPGKR